MSTGSCFWKMQDFMQSLQIRCPVPAHIGLSTAVIARAPIEWPRCLTRFISEIFSSRGQPASVTPKKALLEFAGLFLQASGARVLFLVVTLDTVIRLIECRVQAHPSVGEFESLPMETPFVLRQSASLAIPPSSSVSTGIKCVMSSLCGTLNNTPPSCFSRPACERARPTQRTEQHQPPIASRDSLHRRAIAKHVRQSSCAAVRGSLNSASNSIPTARPLIAETPFSGVTPLIAFF